MMNDDKKFWEQIVCLLISLVCTIEKEKLKREKTTAELRKLGKEHLDKRPEP